MCTLVEESRAREKRERKEREKSEKREKKEREDREYRQREEDQREEQEREEMSESEIEDICARSRAIMALSRERCPETVAVWKTIMVGGLNKDELLKRLVQTGRNVGNWAKDIVSKPAFRTSAIPHEVSFVRVEIRELGFTHGPTTNELFARILNVGNFCEPEDALWLSLEDQSCGDWFWVAMEPITDSDGDRLNFYVERRNDNSERWLYTLYAYPPDDQWNLDYEIVFRSRK
jgi:hypothetical protein